MQQCENNTTGISVFVSSSIHASSSQTLHVRAVKHDTYNHTQAIGHLDKNTPVKPELHATPDRYADRETTKKNRLDGVDVEG